VIAAMPHRPFGLDRDILGGPGDGDDTGPATTRAYRAEMRRQFGRAPSLGELVGSMCEAVTVPDDIRRRTVLEGLQRTMVGYSGAAGGFSLPVGMADDIWDRARQTDGPWARCHWWPVPTRLYWFPVVQEVSRAAGSRWGGFASTWGLPEINMPAQTDGQIAQIEFVANRLLAYSTVSRDLWEDAEKLQRWLSYVAIAEFRYAIESAMILGVKPGDVGPQGVINAPSTVSVARASGGAIASKDIDLLWAAIAPGDSESPNMVFHANKQTIELIDQLAISGAYPEGLYMRAGTSPWTPHATLKGKPLIPSVFCPAVGTAGDLIAVNWGAYVMTYRQRNPQDTTLSFQIDLPQDVGHMGLVGMPADSVEQRVSSHRYFDQDMLALAFKWRGDGRFLWNTTSKDANGNAIGPAAVIHA
jgi:HK97 family phage major capsid protein